MDEKSRNLLRVYREQTTSQQVIPVEADKTTTVQLMSGRPVTMVELTGAVAFHPGGAVLLPCAPEDVSQSALAAVAAAYGYIADNPEEWLLITAHSQEWPELTSRRAEGVEAFLYGERSRWADLALACAEVLDWQLILKWVALFRGWSCDPGTVDGLDGRRTQRGLASFREAYAAKTGQVPGKSKAPTGDDWQAFFACYDYVLAQILGLSPGQLEVRRGSLRRTSPSAIGCQNLWPTERVRIHDYAMQTEERVDLLFFAEEHLPKLKCHAQGEPNWKKCDVYRKFKYRLKAVSGEAPAPEGWEYLACAAIPGMTFDTGTSFLSPTAALGLRDLEALAWKYPQGKIMVWAHTDRVGSDEVNKQLSERRARSVYAAVTEDVDVWVSLDDEEEWGLDVVQEILAHLGHAPGPGDSKDGPRTRGAVKAFQAEAGLAESGKADAETRWALFAEYLARITVDLDPDSFMEPRHAGCGEFNPIAQTDKLYEPNRRVMFYAFHEDRLPSPPCSAGDMGPCREEMGKGSDGSFRCNFYSLVAKDCPCEKSDPLPTPSDAPFLADCPKRSLHKSQPVLATAPAGAAPHSGSLEAGAQSGAPFLEECNHHHP